MPLNLPQLPPDLKEKVGPAVEKAKGLWADAVVQMGPLATEAAAVAGRLVKRLEKAGPVATLGSTFRHIAVVGLNRTELLMQGETNPVQSENWQDLVDDTMRRHTALVFFAPRGLDGQPVNPYLFLNGEGALSDTDDAADPNMLAVAQQSIAGAALLDFCRMGAAAPNTINILLAADTLFHWDIKDNYVLPTTTTGWVRDVEQVMKSYPRTSRFHIYTQWDSDVFPPSDRVLIHKLRDVPLDEGTWLNQPTLQEKYGTHVLTLGIGLAVAFYSGLAWKGRDLTDLQDRVSAVEQQIPRGGQFSDLEKAIMEEEKHMAKRELFPILTKDAARAAQRANFKTTSIEVKVDDVQNPPKQYVVTWEAQKNVYQGWLQEEPAARELMMNTATLQAIRKPPIPNTFKLEGLVNAEDLSKAYTQQVKRFVRAPMTTAAPSTTEPEAPVLPKQNFVGATAFHAIVRSGAAAAVAGVASETVPAVAPVPQMAPAPAAVPGAAPVAAGTPTAMATPAGGPEPAAGPAGAFAPQPDEGGDE